MFDEIFVHGLSPMDASAPPAALAPAGNAVKHFSNAKRQRAVLANRERRSLALRVIDENPR